MTESVGQLVTTDLEPVRAQRSPIGGAVSGDQVVVPALPGLSRPTARRVQQAAPVDRPVPGIVRRHAGADKLEPGKHVASDHSTPAEQAAHDRESQASFDSMTSDQFVAALQPSVTSETKQLRFIDLASLPPALQAQVRMIQAIVTEVEAELAKEEPKEPVLQRLTARFRTGARSWHENDKGKIPPPAKASDDSPRALFFEDMRQGSKGKVPSKQAKKGFDGKRLPYREFTAAGWQQAAQSGRLIYDPIDDLFYLTCKHYDDDKYFCIHAPRTAATSSSTTTRRTTDWDFDLLVFQAWEELAADLHAVAAHADDPKNNPAPALSTDTMSQDALKCVRELYKLRQQYADAVTQARASAEHERKRIEAHLANVKKFEKRGGYKGTTPNLIPYKLADDGSIKIAEQFAPLPWCGVTFYVGSVDGYIGYPVKGYPKSGSVTCPAYRPDTKIGQVGQFFRACLDSGSAAGQEELGALTLAGLVAEATRHPAATLEALFTVIQNTPFQASKPAWAANANKALPMATGGTIATGGIAVEVMQQEGRLGREVMLKMLRKFDEKGYQERVKATAAMPPNEAITQLKAWLFSVLQDSEAQQAVLAAPATSENATDSSQGTKSDAEPEDKPQTKQQADTPVKLAVTPTDPLPVDALPPHTLVVPASTPDAPEEAQLGKTDQKGSTEEQTSKSGTDKSETGKSETGESETGSSKTGKSGDKAGTGSGQRRPQRAPWTREVYRLEGRPQSTGVLHPLDVIGEMADTPDYNLIPNFWNAFAAYRADHAEEVFTLSPINAIQWKAGTPPTSLTIMGPDDWDVWEDFKRQHPEFLYD